MATKDSADERKFYLLKKILLDENKVLERSKNNKKHFCEH